MGIFSRECRVSIQGAEGDKVIPVPKGASLYQVLRDRNIMHTTMCNGKGRCGKCQVQFTETPDAIRVTKQDKLHVGQLLLNNGYRLACRHSVANDIYIALPESSTSNTNKGEFPNNNNNNSSTNSTNSNNNANVAAAGQPHGSMVQPHHDARKGRGATQSAPSAQLGVDHYIAGDASQTQQGTSIPHLAAAAMDDLSEGMPRIAGVTDGIVIYDCGDTVRILQYSATLDKIINDTSIPVNSLQGYLGETTADANTDVNADTGNADTGNADTGNADTGIIDTGNDGSPTPSKAAKFLHQAISEQLLPQVINRTLNIQHSDRVVCVVKEYGDVQDLEVRKNLFGLAFYGSHRIDGVFVEYLQPLPSDTDCSNLEHFLLLSNLHPNGTLILSTKHTDKVYYYAKSGYYEFSTKPLGLPKTMELAEFESSNPITGMRKGIGEVEVLDPAFPPDGITFEAMLQCIRILLERGFMDDSYQFYSRGELAEFLPMELAIKVVAKSKGNRFNIYRDRHSLVSVEGGYVRSVDKYGKGVRALIPLVDKEIAPLVGIKIYSGVSIASVAEFAQGLGIVDKGYRGKISHTVYDGGMVATNYFSTASVDEFAVRYIKGVNCVSISDVPGLAGLIS